VNFIWLKKSEHAWGASPLAKIGVQAYSINGANKCTFHSLGNGIPNTTWPKKPLNQQNFV